MCFACTGAGSHVFMGIQMNTHYFGEKNLVYSVYHVYIGKNQIDKAISKQIGPTQHSQPGSLHPSPLASASGPLGGQPIPPSGLLPASLPLPRLPHGYGLTSHTLSPLMPHAFTAQEP